MPANDTLFTSDDAPTVAEAERTIEETALRLESHAHARVGMRLTTAGALACAALLQLVVHKRPIHWVITGLLIAIAAVAVYIELTVKGISRGRPPARLLLGFLMAVAALLATAYLGLLSSTSLLLVIIVWAFASNDYALEAWAIYLTCALGYLVLVAASLTHLLPLTDSVLALKKENVRALFGFSLLLEMLLAMVFWLAWTSRRATVGAIAFVAQARIEVERRRALLDEARDELRQARDAARLGRFSGGTVGDYRVDQVIGRGAMGEVYAASTRGGERVALKVLHPHLIDSPSEVERFVREVNVTAALDSPHVVRVLGTGTAPDGSPFLAMERLVGMDLSELLRAEGRLSLADTVELVNQVAAALTAAEQAKIVHRDVKPQNLFRVDASAGPRWKVLDFGVSRLLEATSSLTQGAIGTPAYMAPEQCRNAAVDHRADVFALSAIAYRTLTGRPAFSGPDQYAVLYSIVHEQPARPSELCMLPQDVERVLALGLAKDPARRFQSAAELARALDQAQYNALSDALRARAEALLAELPWGSAPAAEDQLPPGQ